MNFNNYVKTSGNFKDKSAFTLAEILIVLAIIGVVASLTIPVVTRKIQQADLKTAFKKNYSAIEQATSMIVTKKGTIKYLCTEDDNTCFANLYKNYLSTIKICPGGTGELLGNCWHKDGEWRELNGGTVSGWDDGDAGLVLTNGAFLGFYDYHPLCAHNDYEIGSPGSFLICAVIHVDVNGFKPPNITGEDIFRIYLQEDGNKPAGIQGARSALDVDPCDTDHDGWSCAAKVLQGK